MALIWKLWTARNAALRNRSDAATIRGKATVDLEGWFLFIGDRFVMSATKLLNDAGQRAKGFLC